MLQPYEKKYTVKDEHIDFQNVVDGIFYPTYFEDCRHEYVAEVLGVNMKEAASVGLNWVLSQYTMKFKRSLSRESSLR